VRDDSNAEASVVDLIDRQADPVDTDRAFDSDVSTQWLWNREAELARVPTKLAGLEPAHAIDVPAHQVATECITQSETRLEVHRIAHRQLPERAALERLEANVCREKIRPGVDDRQTNAAHAHTRSKRSVAFIQARVDHDATGLRGLSK